MEKRPNQGVFKLSQMGMAQNLARTGEGVKIEPPEYGGGGRKQDWAARFNRAPAKSRTL